MSNETKFEITCRFASWKQGENVYPAFGVKYLITVPNEIVFNENEIVEDPVETFFKKKWRETIGRNEKDFDGEVLFMEESNLVTL